MSTDAPHTTAPHERVSWNQLIAFGMGGLIPIALFNIAGQLMGLLGNISLGLSAFWLGAIMVVPRLWEAFSDPIIGHASDNTRSRWGRRRPYLLFGGLAVALTFVAMWWVPRGEWVRQIFVSDAAYNWFQLAYILGGLLLFFTACAIFEIPHGALGLEMSPDPHERTRLFSAKSFLGNFFAIFTPALFLLSSLPYFRGPGGDLTDGMRYVSLFIAVWLVPMSFWWFFTLREPGFAVASKQEKSSFWHDMRITITNSTFLSLTAIIFTLAMGFNFVALFNYYITIFYLYNGDTTAAGYLLWINGMAWALTGLIAVFPLNWLSKRFGKSQTLLIAILLMCAAQLSKIFAYNPELPYLAMIPTVLLSAGMLMFFTLGSSMVGDICDEDELNTGTRSEGTYYSVFWWFIKMGSAFASLVTGMLLVLTTFDEQQNVAVEAMLGDVAVIKSDAEAWKEQDTASGARVAKVDAQLDKVTERADKLHSHFSERLEKYPDQAEHLVRVINLTDAFRTDARALRTRSAALVGTPEDVVRESEALREQITHLKQQTPSTLFRLRLFEIGVPLALSVISILLTLRYPLTEERSYEIKEALKQRHAERASASAS